MIYDYFVFGIISNSMQFLFDAHLNLDSVLDWAIHQAANVNADNRLTSPTWNPMDKLWCYCCLLSYKLYKCDVVLSFDRHHKHTHTQLYIDIHIFLIYWWVDFFVCLMVCGFGKWKEKRKRKKFGLHCFRVKHTKTYIIIEISFFPVFLFFIFFISERNSNSERCVQ